MHRNLQAIRTGSGGSQDGWRWIKKNATLPEEGRADLLKKPHG